MTKIFKNLYSYIFFRINKNIYAQKTCTRIFIAALFTIAQYWQLSIFSGEEWINKL
jgi:tryptophan-rich sensory protein